MNGMRGIVPPKVAQRGASLIEVMIAVLVFSIGLLGAGIMNSSAMKNTHNAYLRTQASFLADALAERMRANPAGVTAAAYVGTFSGAGPALPTCGVGASPGCTAAQVAQRDLSVVGTQIATLLPAGNGTVACAIAPLVVGAGVPPVNGSCTVTLNWGESRDVDNDGYSGTQSFQLVFQP